MGDIFVFHNSSPHIRNRGRNRTLHNQQSQHDQEKYPKVAQSALIMSSF